MTARGRQTIGDLGTLEDGTSRGTTVLHEGRRALRTRPRRWLLVVTLLLGLLPAAGLAATETPARLSLALLTAPVQSLMSFTLPFVGVLMVSDLRRETQRFAVGARLLAAGVLAVLVAVFGVLVCVVAVGLAAEGPGRWQHAGNLVVGSLLVMVTAQLTGTGFGLLLRSRAAAMVATVLPLGLWALLGLGDGLRQLQSWVTPYASAQHLLSGRMTGLNWAQTLVVLLLWGVGLNVWGARRLARRSRSAAA